MSTRIKTNRETWIDLAKCFAIIAVICDHASSEMGIAVPYTYIFFFSVSLFVLLMGYVNYDSFERNHSDVWKKTKNRIIGILIPYLTATFVYSVLSSGGLYLEKYISELIHFSASPPLYYVSVYLQLVLIAPVLYRVLTSGHKVCDLTSLIIILIFSIWANNYTHLLQIYGGGGKLFGGTYLLLFYIGMLICKYFKKIVFKKKTACFCFIFFLALLIACACFIVKDGFGIETYLPFDKGVNPPGLCLIIYSVSITLSFLFFDKIPKRKENAFLDRIVTGLSFVGRHTLYIFLYHKLFQDFVLRVFFIYVPVGENLRGILYPVVMLLAPLLLEYVFKRAQHFIETCYAAEVTTLH